MLAETHGAWTRQIGGVETSAAVPQRALGVFGFDPLLQVGGRNISAPDGCDGDRGDLTALERPRGTTARGTAEALG